jgi:polysaccharide export outer membrane protein
MKPWQQALYTLNYLIYNKLNMEKYRQYLIIGLVFFTITLILASCTSVKNIPYLKDISDSTMEKSVATAVYKDPIILNDDILSINIITIDPTTSAPVNQTSPPPVLGSSTGVVPETPGWLVDKNGDISLQIIGTVHVAGLTTSEAKALITEKTEKYFKNPDVQVRFANFKITVLGEVAHPSSFIIPNEKISVLDALGLAGDLTIYGRRDNVLVIRDNNGKKELSRLDLNSSDMFQSPFFYLKQNDIVYVQPNKSKAIQADAEQTRIITIAASIITGLILYLRISANSR